MAYPNKKCTFANRVVRRSKSQNISALALSLNRYHKSATPPFYSDIQSDTRFLIIPCKDNKIFSLGYKQGINFLHNIGYFMPQRENAPHANTLIYWVIKFFCFPLIFGVCACSGHPKKLQVINFQSLAIFTFSPCQRRVNRSRRKPPHQSKWMPLPPPE